VPWESHPAGSLDRLALQAAPLAFIFCVLELGEARASARAAERC
jgi:hypothetical protein